MRFVTLIILSTCTLSIHISCTYVCVCVYVHEDRVQHSYRHHAVICGTTALLALANTHAHAYTQKRLRTKMLFRLVLQLGHNFTYRVDSVRVDYDSLSILRRSVLCFALVSQSMSAHIHMSCILAETDNARALVVGILRRQHGMVKLMIPL